MQLHPATLVGRSGLIFLKRGGGGGGPTTYLGNLYQNIEQVLPIHVLAIHLCRFKNLSQLELHEAHVPRANINATNADNVYRLV